MNESIKEEIMTLLGSKDKLIAQRRIIDSSKFVRYIFKIDSKDPEQLKRSLTKYKLQHLKHDFFWEQEQGLDIAHYFAKIIPLIDFIKNLIIPIKAILFFRTDESIDTHGITKLLEDQYSGVSDNLPEPTLIRGTKNVYRCVLKIDKEVEFDEKFNRFQEQNKGIDIFVVYDRPTIKMYIPVILSVAAFAIKIIYDTFFVR